MPPPAVRPVTAAIEIVAAERGRARAEFLDLPYRLHRDDPQFVPPLRRDQKILFDRVRHPFFAHAEAAFFLARRDGRPVGRIEAIVNHAHNRFHDDRVGFFGAFECEPSEAVAGALLEHAAAWLRARGLDVMRGPVTHSTNEECGLLVDGFGEPPFVGMPYNPPRYPGLIEAAGLTSAKDLHAWEILLEGAPAAELEKFAAMVLHDGRVRIRPIDPKQYAREARIFMDLYNGCWERNWGFVPFTEAEFMFAAEQMRPLVTRYPEGAVIAEVNGEPAGFCLAIADANQALIRVRTGRLLPFGFLRLSLGLRRVTQARLIALGVRPEFRRLGLDAVFALHLLTLGQRLGFRRAELGWTLDDNRAVRRIIQRVAAVITVRRAKTYRLYDFPLR